MSASRFSPNLKVNSSAQGLIAHFVFARLLIIKVGLILSSGLHMSKYRKIVWNEGMLLTPQHFQQFDNYHEELLNSCVRSMMQHEYGVLELRFSAEAIANGNFQITTCRAVLPDGMFVNVP